MAEIAGPGDGERVRTSPQEWFDAGADAERRGELLTAVDIAEQGLAEHPDALRLKHLAVLALARAGATDEAAARFRRYGLGAVDEPDVVALAARIAKDRALDAAGDERSRRASHARDLYQRLYSRTGEYYPAVNAATLSLLAGEPWRARKIAREVLDILGRAEDASYYAAATEGEARLILREVDRARDALLSAAARHGGDHGALATTRRQLRLVCDLSGLDPGLVDALSGPRVAHFCGHRIARRHETGPFPSDAQDGVAENIRAVLRRQPVGYAYGALASGADILWAEALLEQGSELHVVLPFARDEFIETSVAPSGGDWVARFDECLRRARHVTYATDDAFLGDDVLFRYGSELAMGLALLRGGYLDAEVCQLAVWDGRQGCSEAGTATDVATWRKSGRAATVIAPTTHGAHAPPHPGPAGAERTESVPGRVVRAMLFADVRGFSKLTDEQAMPFTEHVLGAFGSVLDRARADVEYRNTWGDAMFVVFRSPTIAAEGALALQAAMEAIDLAATGLPAHLALRVSVHIGPVFPVRDPVRGVDAFAGSHVNRTARIEPVTPAGAVYVTEPFAAALALDSDSRFACDYVGHMPAAKDYGRVRMHRLRTRRRG